MQVAAGCYDLHRVVHGSPALPGFRRPRLWHSYPQQREGQQLSAKAVLNGSWFVDTPNHAHGLQEVLNFFVIVRSG